MYLYSSNVPSLFIDGLKFLLGEEGFKNLGVEGMRDEHEDLAFIIHINVLNGCGCSNIEENLTFIYDVLKHLQMQRDKEKSWRTLMEDSVEFVDVIKTPGIFDFVLNTFDELELIEHGNNIYNGWLTEKGCALGTVLQEIINEDITLPFVDNLYVNEFPKQ